MELAYYANQLKTVLGMPIEVEVVERGTFLAAMNAGQVAFFPWAWSAAYPDGLYFLRDAVDRLAAAGVEIRLSAGRADFGVMHHKYALADGAWLLTGSYNFSQNGEMNNHENALFSTRPGELGAYGREFAFLWDQGRFSDLGTLGGATTLARDINDAGGLRNFL